MALKPTDLPSPAALDKLGEAELLELVRSQPLPAHVAIIMDGNGRWATRRGFPRVAGHREGVKAARSVVRAAYGLGLRYLTELVENNVRLRVIGRPTGVPTPVRRGLEHVVRETRNNTGLTLLVAFN